MRKDLDEHVAVTCQWRMIHCSYCSVSLPQGGLPFEGKKSHCALNVFTIVSFHKVKK